MRFRFLSLLWPLAVWIISKSGGVTFSNGSYVVEMAPDEYQFWRLIEAYMGDCPCDVCENIRKRLTACSECGGPIETR